MFVFNGDFKCTGSKEENKLLSQWTSNLLTAVNNHKLYNILYVCNMSNKFAYTLTVQCKLSTHCIYKDFEFLKR